MRGRPSPLEYEEARFRVRWWWHFVYGERVTRNWLLLFLAVMLIVAGFLSMVALFGFAG